MSPAEFAELKYLVQVEARRGSRELATCVGKHRFANKAEAERAIRPGKRVFLHSFPCPYCGSWHLGGKRPLLANPFFRMRRNRKSDEAPA